MMAEVGGLWHDPCYIPFILPLKEISVRNGSRVAPGGRFALRAVARRVFASAKGRDGAIQALPCTAKRPCPARDDACVRSTARLPLTAVPKTANRPATAPYARPQMGLLAIPPGHGQGGYWPTARPRPHMRGGSWSAARSWSPAPGLGRIWPRAPADSRRPPGHTPHVRIRPGCPWSSNALGRRERPQYSFFYPGRASQGLRPEKRRGWIMITYCIKSRK